jgi:hypothetical protein
LGQPLGWPIYFVISQAFKNSYSLKNKETLENHTHAIFPFSFFPSFPSTSMYELGVLLVDIFLKT